ncbi:MAG: TatD family nuclease-associated radical SAM protein [Clostridiaceae bacterium]|jgi:TatD family-associated radical SAM protein|nr:TatD family nuclease-associated radical SAM protein [Clostridiaceae bacterium]
MSNTLAYFLDGKIYINLTNRCTNDCVFCLRSEKSDVCGQEMWLDSEDFSAAEVISQLDFQIKNHKEVKDIVFCGYGEPTLKLDILKEVAKYVKEKYSDKKIRINTNGTANIVYKRNIVPELKGLIDTISVSLNAENEKEYNRLSQPKLNDAYNGVLNFMKASSDCGIETVASIVDGYNGEHHDIDLCKKIAKDNGATLRVREYIENGYS